MSSNQDLKSMVSAGLTALASSSYDLRRSVTGERSMNVLCIGHGGGTLPLFLASKIKGAIVHIVEIDPVVVTASIQAMGFPVSALKQTPQDFSCPPPSDADQLLYGDASERLFLFQSDAEDFILNSQNLYDLVFIDAYDGDDIFPRKLWDRDGPFLESLHRVLHPGHGTIVVNLHADFEVSDSNEIDYSRLPMGEYISQVCRAYKERVGLAFMVSVPWLCNMTLVACNGVGFGSGVLVDRDLVMRTLVTNSCQVELLLDLPFPCLQYIKGRFSLVN